MLSIARVMQTEMNLHQYFGGRPCALCAQSLKHPRQRRHNVTVLHARFPLLLRAGVQGRAHREHWQPSQKHHRQRRHNMTDLHALSLRCSVQEFKDVLTVRTDSLKHHKERRQLFSSGPGADAEAALPLLRPQLQSSAATDPGACCMSMRCLCITYHK